MTEEQAEDLDQNRKKTAGAAEKTSEENISLRSGMLSTTPEIFLFADNWPYNLVLPTTPAIALLKSHYARKAYNFLSL